MSTDQSTNIDINTLKNILEASLLAASQPLSMVQISALFSDTERPASDEIHQALELLAQDCENRGVELVEVASGWRLQIRQNMHLWISRMWTEKPQRYSRALLETLALIAYRQPITRGEIEDVRGVSVSSSIIRTMQERDWIRVIGHRDVPGKPALLGTTRAFLDYFNLKSLDELPNLAEIQEMVTSEPELDLEGVEREKQRQQKEDERVEPEAITAVSATPLDNSHEEGEMDLNAEPDTTTDNSEHESLSNE